MLFYALHTYIDVQRIYKRPLAVATTCEKWDIRYEGERGLLLSLDSLPCLYFF